MEDVQGKFPRVRVVPYARCSCSYLRHVTYATAVAEMSGVMYAAEMMAMKVTMMSWPGWKTTTEIIAATGMPSLVAAVAAILVRIVGGFGGFFS